MKDKILNFIIILCLLVIFIYPIFGRQITAMSGNIKKFSEEQIVNIKNNFNRGNQPFSKKEIKKRYNKNNSNRQTVVKHINKNNLPIPIPVNPPTELSYKTKQYVYEQRKKYVAESIFANPYYQPSEAVFGQIVDNKPWVSVNFCPNEYGTAIITGPSEESRFINNPTILVAVEYPYRVDDDVERCTNPTKQLIPKEIEYKSNKKEIVVTYGSLPYNLTNSDTYYTFNGINARDLGYNYAYIDTKKTTFPIIMKEKYNITNQVIEFENFIHLGGSCKVEGGCNNGSPDQPMLNFKYKDREYKRHYRKIYIKLWKNRPFSPEDTPDMIEIIRFRSNF